MPIKYDQTKPEWIDTDAKQYSLGTGILLVRSPEVKKIYIEHITYHECWTAAKRHSAAMMKWIPNRIASCKSLKKSRR